MCLALVDLSKLFNASDFDANAVLKGIHKLLPDRLAVFEHRLLLEVQWVRPSDLDSSRRLTEMRELAGGQSLGAQVHQLGWRGAQWRFVLWRHRTLLILTQDVLSLLDVCTGAAGRDRLIFLLLRAS
jgi:hypothetical protein